MCITPEVLITIDIKLIDSNNTSIRDNIYNELNGNGWKKIENITTAWKFQVDFIDREKNEIFKDLIDNLKTAKGNYRNEVNEITYAMQYGNGKVVTGKI